jgi:hypothetical protein
MIAAYAAPITVPNFSFETAALSLTGGNGHLSQLIAASTIFTQGYVGLVDGPFDNHRSDCRRL